MLIGHYAVGLASKRLSPRTPLWVLLAAPVFLDLLWPIALLTGLESVRVDRSYSAVVPLDLHDYPYTHSLATAVGGRSCSRSHGWSFRATAARPWWSGSAR